MFLPPHRRVLCSVCGIFMLLENARRRMMTVWWIDARNDLIADKYLNCHFRVVDSGRLYVVRNTDNVTVAVYNYDRWVKAEDR